jgi:uncharacterized protein YtpQ (UPF0354 family)
MEKNIQRGRRIFCPMTAKSGTDLFVKCAMAFLKGGDVKTTNNSGGDYSKMIEHAMMTSYHRSFDENTVVAIDHSDLKLYAHNGKVTYCPRW